MSTYSRIADSEEALSVRIWMSCCRVHTTCHTVGGGLLPTYTTRQSGTEIGASNMLEVRKFYQVTHHMILNRNFLYRHNSHLLLSDLARTPMNNGPSSMIRIICMDVSYYR